MEIVTTGRGTREKIEFFVAGALIGYVFVTIEAVVFWDRESHGFGALSPMFNVACDTTTGIEFLELSGVSGVCEFFLRMGVFRFIEVGSMAVKTGLLFHSHHGRVAGAASQFDLIVSVRR